MSKFMSVTTYSHIHSCKHRLLQPIRLQFSLLVLVNSHFLNRIFKFSLEEDLWDPHLPFLLLIKKLPFFFEKLGYVMLLETHTFPIASEQLSQLLSLASFFGANVRSLFLHVDRCFDPEALFSSRHVISGLKLNIELTSDFNFLNFSSPFFFPQLKRLDLFVGQDSDFDTDSDHQIIVLSESLLFNTTITDINLSRNFIGPKGAVALGSWLRLNTTVIRIHLGWNYIRVEGAIALAGSIEKLAGVEAEGAIALAEALKVNCSITKIKLRSNSIGSKGGIAIANSLKMNSTVTEISLNHNSIDDVCMIALAEMLKVNSTLIEIDLRNNSIGNEGAIALAHGLKLHSTLTKVNLWGNSIVTEGAMQLAYSIQYNSSIIGINLVKNSIDKENIQLIRTISNDRIKC
ncbi:hypothetical protein GEMRC1_010058 [Eukaryota sp. GEM-RC1]